PCCRGRALALLASLLEHDCLPKVQQSLSKRPNICNLACAAVASKSGQRRSAQLRLILGDTDMTLSNSVLGARFAAGAVFLIASVALQLVESNSDAQESVLVAAPRAQAAEQRIRLALQQPISCNYVARPLNQVVEELGRRLAINALLDVEGFRCAGLM